MSCIPEDDAHSEECIKGTNPCAGSGSLSEDDGFTHETESNYASIGNAKREGVRA